MIGFNQVVIKGDRLDIAFCDCDEEKEQDAHTLALRVMPVTSDDVIHDDPGPETLSSALQGYLYSFLKAKHNLSVET